MTHFALRLLLDFLRRSGLQVQPNAQNTDTEFQGLASLEQAGARDISFLANPKYQDQLQGSNAGAVFVKPALEAQCKGIALVTDNPYLAYAKTSQFIQKQRGDVLDLPVGVHPSAIIDPAAQLGTNVAIGAGVVVGADCVIGDDVHINALTVIGRGANIGSGTKIGSHVAIYDQVHIGARCRIHSNTTLGADGFGYAPTADGWEPIAQLGRVIIEDDVHVGANTSIDRGALEDTVICKGVIIDNQVQIAHNVTLGPMTAVAGCAGVAGSTKVGARCTLAGAAGLSGHLNIADDVHIGMQAQVTNSITEPGHYASGTGLYPVKQWRRLVVRLRQLAGR